MPAELSQWHIAQLNVGRARHDPALLIRLTRALLCLSLAL
jgi:hypothetical protein